MREEEFVVSYSSCDCSGRTNIASLTTMFQDIVSRHHFGYTINRQIELGMLWVLISWQVDVKRFPECDETIKVRTYLNEVDRFLARRTFSVIDEDGNTIATATSNSAFCNRATGHPTRMPPEYVAAHERDIESTCDFMPLSNRAKISYGDKIGEFRVSRHDIDINRHMNNISYIKNALDFLDINFEPHFMQIYYEHPAFFGDDIDVYRLEDAGETHMCLKKDRQILTTLLLK